MIRALIVDDEPLAREGLRTRLSLERDIVAVGEADDGPSSVEAIRLHEPDLLFLDIQMPGMNGFEVLRAIAPHVVPVVVFVTAFDRFALQAFEANAMDYLLKPYSGARFAEALRRARRELDVADLAERHARIRRVLELDPTGAGTREAPAGPAPVIGRLPVTDGDRILLLDASEIDYLQSAGNYVRVHARARVFQVRSTLRALEEQLDGRRFVRIHRSTILNADRVAEVRPEWHGDFDITLTTGATLRMSRTYRRNLIP